jgi:soluble lytic murein transglycosylase
MPRVPTYDNFQTQASGQPNVQLQTPSGPAPGAIAADQAGQFGQAMTRAGDVAGRIALDMADQANQVRVNDARNQLAIATQDLTYNKDGGFLTRKGANVFLDEQGKPLEKSLDQDYGEKLQKTISDINATLGNDQQRRAFSMHAGDAAAQFHGQLQTHTLQQFGYYKDATDDATAKLAGQTAGLNWNNPDVVAASVDQAKAAIRSKAERAGLVGSPFEEAVLAGTSAIHEGVILSALQNNNPKYAMDYLAGARKKGEMAPNDILKVYGHITEADALQQAQGAVQKQTVAVMPAVAPNGFDRMTQITLGSESNGQRYGPDGKTLLTSVAGAKGEMQVLDGTKLKPGFGVKPAQDNSPDERARVGRDYLKAMLSKYGDPAQAWAAYNAGPGTLDKALAASAQGRGQGDWLSYLPQETQAYVTKNVKALSGNAPVMARPTELDFVNGALANLGANASPQAIKHTREAAAQQFGVINKSLNERGDNALADAQRWVIENKATSLGQLPPQLKDALTQFAPGKMDDLDKFAKAQGLTVTNDSLYLKLATDPGALTALSDAQFRNLRTDLSEQDFKKFADERALKLKGGGSNGPGELNTQAITDTMRDRLRSLKMDPTPKDGSSEAEQLGTIHRFVRNELGEAQRSAGKKFSDVETAKFIDGLFAKNVTFKGFFGGVNSQSLLSLKPGDVPSDISKALKADFAKAGVASPTDSDILGAYLRLKTRTAKNNGTTGSY